MDHQHRKNGFPEKPRTLSRESPGKARIAAESKGYGEGINPMFTAVARPHDGNIRGLVESRAKIQTEAESDLQKWDILAILFALL
jgi:hypothetical protein